MTTSSPRSSRAALWSMADAVTASVFSTLTYLIMSWFIPTAEFGVGMLAIAVAMIVGSAVEALFSDYIIANPRLRRVQLRVLGGASLTVAVTLAVAMVLAAPVIQRATGAPNLAVALRALTSVVLCAGLSAVPLACLKRDMAFATLARRTVVVRLLSCGLGLVLALRGFGLWSIVGQQIALSGVNAVVLLTIRPVGFGPPWRFRTLRPAFGFVAGNFFPAVMSGNVNRILILVVGTVAGPSDVAFVSMAARIVDAVTFPLLGGLGQVTLPILARARAAGQPLGETYRKAASLTSAIAMPAFFGLAALAPAFTAAVLAPRWAPTAAFLSLLAAERGVRISCALNQPLLSALGRPLANLKISLLDTTVGLTLLAAMSGRGAVYGIAGWCAKAFVYLPVSLTTTAHLSGIAAGTLARASRTALVTSVGMVGACLAVGAALPAVGVVPNPRVLLALQLVLGGLAYVGLFRLLESGAVQVRLDPVATVAGARRRAGRRGGRLAAVVSVRRSGDVAGVALLLVVVFPRRGPPHRRARGSGLMTSRGDGAGAARVSWVDWAKALGMLAVVYGHARGANPAAVHWLFSFHMPLFFLLSGYLLKEAQLVRGPRQFLADTTLAIAPAYVAFALVGLSAWFLVLRRFGAAEVNAGTLMERALGTLYGTGTPSRIHVEPLVLWFLPCLFTARLLVFAGQRLGRRGGLVASLSLAAMGLVWPVRVVLPFELESALVAQAFMVLGLETARVRLVDRAPRPLALAALLAAMGAVCGFANGPVDLRISRYGNPLLFVIGALSTPAAIALVARRLRPSRVAGAVASSTLVIFPLHPLLFATFSAACMFVLPVPVDFRERSFVALALSVLNVALLTLVAPLVRRVTPWIYGVRARDRASAGGTSAPGDSAPGALQTQSMVIMTMNGETRK